MSCDAEVPAAGTFTRREVDGARRNALLIEETCISMEVFGGKVYCDFLNAFAKKDRA